MLQELMNYRKSVPGQKINIIASLLPCATKLLP